MSVDGGYVGAGMLAGAGSRFKVVLEGLSGVSWSREAGLDTNMDKTEKGSSAGRTGEQNIYKM
jgi:hypothetical protein